MRITPTQAILACALLAIAKPLDATVVEPLSARALVERADVIVHGQVLFAVTGDDPERGLRTVTALDVNTTFKGHARDVETIYQVGGTGAVEETWVSGAHRFVPGEEVVVFARRYGMHLVTIGVGLGTYLVVDGRLVEAPSEVIRVRDLQAEERLDGSTLQALAARVRAYLDEDLDTGNTILSTRQTGRSVDRLRVLQLEERSR